jgi:hypothetical protein
VKVYVGGIRQRVTYVGKDGQVNVKVAGLAPGRHEVRVECGGVNAGPAALEITD